MKNSKSGTQSSRNTPKKSGDPATSSAGPFNKGKNRSDAGDVVDGAIHPGSVHHRKLQLEGTKRVEGPSRHTEDPKSQNKVKVGIKRGKGKCRNKGKKGTK